MKSEYNNNLKAKENTGLAEGKNVADYGGTKREDSFVGSDEELDKPIPYPKSVFFIITNEFCERFSYYGMKAVLAIYLQNELNYHENKATVIYHVFSMLCYFTPIFGAMLADSLLGKFKTILYLSLVYALGNIVLAASATPPLGIPIETFSIIGLLLIAIGTGGIKPCVSAFGGDQFTLPQQATQLASFFSIFYFAINAGSLLSTFITPIFRKDVQCFKGDTCYPLAFGVPAVLMIVSLIVFVCGYRWYKIREPEGNITADVGKCVAHAIREKARSSGGKKEHFLDYAAGKYDWELINSVKQVLRVLVLFIPLPVFWALFDQQGSRWTFQATRMDGEVFGYIIKPDQMQVLNPLLILAFIPIFDQGIYPALGKVGILKKPLQRLAMGGILAGCAFIISGFLELKLEPTYAVKLAENEAHLNFVSNVNCPFEVEVGGESGSIDAFGQFIFKQIEAGEKVAKFTPVNCTTYGPKEYKFQAVSEQATSYVISESGGAISIDKLGKPDTLAKNGEGAALIKVMALNLGEGSAKGTLRFKTDKDFSKVWEEPKTKLDEHGNRNKPKEMPGIPVDAAGSNVFKVEPNRYTMTLVIPGDETKEDSKEMVITIGEIYPRQGGNYLYVVKKEGDKFEIHEHIITQPNSIHMFWLVPQYVVITVAEIMFSITGLQFAFSQAPTTMKSVLQAAWLLTVAFGNVIVVFIAELELFEEQSKEFFLYSGLMFVDIMLFSVLAYFYKPIETTEKPPSQPSNNVEMRENRSDQYDP